MTSAARGSMPTAIGSTVPTARMIPTCSKAPGRDPRDGAELADRELDAERNSRRMTPRSASSVIARAADEARRTAR